MAKVKQVHVKRQRGFLSFEIFLTELQSLTLKEAVVRFLGGGEDSTGVRGGIVEGAEKHLQVLYILPIMAAFTLKQKCKFILTVKCGNHGKNKLRFFLKPTSSF